MVQAVQEAGDALKLHFSALNALKKDPDPAQDETNTRTTLLEIGSVIESKIVLILGSSYSCLTKRIKPLEIPESPYQWRIDWLDGTPNYAHNDPDPYWSVSIGLYDLKLNTLLTSVIYIPFLEESKRRQMFITRKDKGTFLNGERVSINSFKPPLESASILLETNSTADNDNALKSIRPYVETLRSGTASGSAVVDLLFLIPTKHRSRLDAFIAYNLPEPWDLDMPILALQEAGGMISESPM